MFEAKYNLTFPEISYLWLKAVARLKLNFWGVSQIGLTGFPMFFPFSHRPVYTAFFISRQRKKSDLICLDNFC